MEKSKFFGAIRLTILWIFNVLYLPLASVLNICSFRVFSREVVYRLARGWGKTCFFILGIKLDVKNRECLDRHSPKIIVFNHTSTLDVLIHAALFPKGGCAIGKKQFMYIPFLNLAWWAMGYVFLDRENREKSHQQLEKISAWMLRKNITIIISPEGTRSKTGYLQPFKMGVFHIAHKLKVPIYPMVIEGAKELMPHNTIIPTKGTIRVRMLDPISTESWTSENLKEKSLELRELYLNELGETGEEGQTS